MALALGEITGEVGVITMNNLAKRNCLSSALIEDMFAILDDFETSGVRVVILRAPAGSKVWSAGHDVGDLPKPGRDPLPYGGHFLQLLRRVQDYPDPIIAMIEGGVWGGACNLALSCDILIGCENATFTMTPAKVGIPYNPSGMIHFINVIGINKVKEMFFTAAPISANDALNVGILNHLVPAAELETFTYEIAAKIVQNSSLAIRALKSALRLLSKGHPLSAETFEMIQAIRRHVYDSQDYEEGIRALQEKRPPRFQGR